MFNVKEFDIVIGNPPYIKEYTNREAFDGLRNSPYYKGKTDLWYLFTCKGIDLLKENGIITLIAQNNWITNYGASKLRDKVIKETTILQLIDFSICKIFGFTNTQTMIMSFKKDQNTDNYQFDYRKIKTNKPNFNDIIDILNKNDNNRILYLNPKVVRRNFKDKILTFSSYEIENLLNKIKKNGILRLLKKEITNGIICPQDFVNKTSQKILGDNFNIGNGIFVLSNKEKENLGLNNEELELIKPCYTTKELSRYYGDSKNSKWIIYTDSRFKNPDSIKIFPNIKKHLDKFQAVITSDNKPYGLHRAREEKFFKGEKIISLRKCIKPTFTYTDFDCYVSSTFYIIKTERFNLKYLTGLLNSKLIEFWLKYKGKLQGDNYQIDKEPLLNIPLPTINPTNDLIVKQIESLVDKIISAKKENKNANTSNWEQEINKLVYKLYDLTKEEIKIIEENIS